MTDRPLKAIRCRCGHDKPQHKPLDTHGLEWCRACGCSMFEPLHQPDQPPSVSFLILAGLDLVDIADVKPLIRP